MLTLLRLFRSTRLGREEGQVLPIFAAGAAAMLIMTGVVVDGGNLFQNRQSLQNAADAAAVAAAQYIGDPTKGCGTTDPMGACAGKYAGLNGVNDAAGNPITSLGKCPASVTETAPPPAPGCYVYPYTPPGAATSGYVEVWLTKRIPNFFGGLVGIGTTTESARAVGTVSNGPPPPISFAALNDDPSCPNHTLLIKLGGNLTVDSGIYVNSCNDHDGFDVFGATTGGSITAPKIEVHGGWETHNSSHVYVPSGTLCTAPHNPDYKIFWPPGYNPTPTGCPDVGQPEIADPFGAFPPAPLLGAGNLGPPLNILKIKRVNNVATAVLAGNQTNLNGKSVDISNVGQNFDGDFTVTTAAYDSATDRTTLTYANSGTDLPVITQKQMSGGVATLTTNVPTTLTVGESDLSVSGILGFNVNPPGSGATVTATGSSSFSYQPPAYTLSISKKQLQSGTATLTVPGPGTPTDVLDPGDTVSISGVGTEFDGSWTITSIPSGTTFKFGDSRPSTLNVTQKAASRGVATLTAANNLNVGDTVTVNTGDPKFDGTFTVSSASGTQFSYSDSNLPSTRTISPTAVSMTGGVVTVTTSESLTNNVLGGDTVSNVSFGNVNFDSGPFTISSILASGFGFKYTTPAISVPVASGSIATVGTGPGAKIVATLTTSKAHGLATGDQVNVNTGDEAYDSSPVTITKTGANTFTYVQTPPQITNVAWTLNSLSSATFTTTSRHDTNITSITTSGAAPLPGNLNNKTFTTGSGTLSVGSKTTFDVSGSGFTPGGAVSYAPKVTLNSAMTANSTTADITWGGTGGDPVSQGDYIRIENEDMLVTGGTAPTSPNHATLTVSNRGHFGTSAGVAGHASGKEVKQVPTTGTNASIQVNQAGLTTFSQEGFSNASETAVTIGQISNPGDPQNPWTATVPYFLEPTNSGGTVTAPGFVPANTSVSPAGTATLTDVPLLPAPGLFLPAWMPTFGIAAQNLPGSPGIPSPNVITTDTTLGPGTYYGGICIGVAAGVTNCAGTNCKAAGGSTTSLVAYSPAVTVGAGGQTGDDTDPTYTRLLVNNASPIAVGDRLAIDDEEEDVVAITGNVLTVTREVNGTEDAAHTANTPVVQVVTTLNGTAYAPNVTVHLTAPQTIVSATDTVIPVNSATPVGVGDIIQIKNASDNNSEAMTVTAISGNNLTVTRGTYGTTQATHANNAAVLKIFDASAPAPPNVTLSKGVYIMAGGGFSICGAASLNAPNGVMIYNTNDPGHPTGNGALAQVNINTAGTVHLHAMQDGIYKGMTIFQDRSLTLVPGANCGGKSTSPSQWDIALQSAAPLGANGALASVTGTIYAPHLGADFGDTMSGKSRLAIITSCIYINGATSEFLPVTNGGPGGGAGASAALGG